MPVIQLHRTDGSLIAEREATSLTALVEALVEEGINLTYAKLSGAKLNDAKLSGAKLSGADLSYADLSGADLSGAKLNYADLSYANLNYAKLNDAKLNYAKLNYAKLSYANLNDAKLNDADLSGAKLNYAKLSGAKLSGAKGDILQINGGKHSLIAVPDGRIFIGCQTGTYDWWMEQSEMAAKQGYDEQLTAEYKLRLDFAKAWIERTTARITAKEVA